jgi:hypothetical protein
MKMLNKRSLRRHRQSGETKRREGTKKTRERLDTDTTGACMVRKTRRNIFHMTQPGGNVNE